MVLSESDSYDRGIATFLFGLIISPFLSRNPDLMH